MTIESVNPRDEHKQMLSDLLGNARHALNDWEHRFCEDVLNRMLKYPKMELSDKQVAVLNKIWNIHMEKDSKKDPTPEGNPPAQITERPHRHERFVKQYEDFDPKDDIPF